MNTDISEASAALVEPKQEGVCNCGKCKINCICDCQDNCEKCDCALKNDQVEGVVEESHIVCGADGTYQTVEHGTFIRDNIKE